MQNTLVSCLLLIFTLSACSLDTNEQFIQGSWQIAQPGTGNEFLLWNFSNGTFTREQEIDRGSSLYTTGRYQVTENETDVLTLELFDFSGDRISYENNPMTIKIEIDRTNDTARITNTLFVRAGP
jgi:hypothetical protein